MTKDIQSKSTPPFKLKAKQGKNIQFINMKQFDFSPETMIIERVINQKNVFKVHAILEKK